MGTHPLAKSLKSSYNFFSFVYHPETKALQRNHLCPEITIIRQSSMATNTKRRELRCRRPLPAPPHPQRPLAARRAAAVALELRSCGRPPPPAAARRSTADDAAPPATIQTMHAASPRE